MAPDPDATRDDNGMPSWRRSLGEAGPYLGLGMQIALSMALFVAIGYALDAWIGTLPWLTIAGALIGMGAVFYHLVRVLNEMNRSSTSRKQHRQSPSGKKTGDRSGPDAPAGGAPNGDHGA